MVAEVIAETAIEPTRYRFTVADFERLYETGILTESDRVELLDGELLQMSKVGGQHTGCIIRLDRTIQRAAPSELLVSVQNPLLLDERAEFLPDLIVFHGNEQRNANPSAEQVVLVIEVADSSRHHDRTRKFPRYAAAGIPEAWLIDLTEDRIERHTDPRADGYRQIILARRGESLPSSVVDGLSFDVDAVLGPRDETDDA